MPATTRPADGRLPYNATGFWRRYAAWSLDAAIVALPVLAITWSRMASALHEAGIAFDALAARVSGLLLDILSSSKDVLSMALAALSDSGVRVASATLQSALWRALQPGVGGFLMVAAVYWIACECSPWQATPGKRALGLRVTDVDGQRIGFGRALARHLAGALSWLTLNLGHLLAAVPPERRALHDFVAGTRVLQGGDAERLPAWAQVWLLLQALVAIASTAWLLQALQGALRQAIEGVI